MNFVSPCGNWFLMLVLLNSLLNSVLSLDTKHEVEIEALISFKSFISHDSVEVLVDWNNETHHCIWTGISCRPVSNRVISISLRNKQLKGQISPFIGNISTLRVLNLASNLFSGLIPVELGYLKNLRFLELGENFLKGSIPLTIVECKKLLFLDLSGNMLSGQIPDDIIELKFLRSLNLSGNTLSGELPTGIAKLHSLISLDLSLNNFSGRIPDTFTTFTNLKFLSLSSNQLEGPVPAAGIFQNLSLGCLSGNLALCGTTHLRPCNEGKQSNVSGFILLGGALFICGQCFRKRKKKKEFTQNIRDQGNSRIFKFYQTLLETATQCFDEQNVICRSGRSTIYRGTFSPKLLGHEYYRLPGLYHEYDRDQASRDQNRDQKTVVVKKWELFQASRESDNCFLKELEVTDLLRHRNLVRMLGYGFEIGFKVLVLEYMENGSLDRIIHDPRTNMSRWSFSERLKVCISIANAMVYLHSEYGDPIVHGDLRPSKILFDGDWEAHVSNFGTTRMLGVGLHDGISLSSASAFYSTCYLAPEYAHTSQLTTKADVFSFGILVMEFLIARRRTETCQEIEFPSPMTLPQFVKASLDNDFKSLLQVMDPDFATSITIQEEEDRMKDLLGLALQCTHPNPEDRPDMNVVLPLLQRLKVI